MQECPNIIQSWVVIYNSAIYGEREGGEVMLEID